MSFEKKQSYYFVLLLALLVVAFGSCKYSNSPEATAKKFLISFNRLDIKTAKSVSTPETWEILNIMADATKGVSNQRKAALGAHFSVKILNTRKESDSTVIVTFQTLPKRLPFNQFRMYKDVDRFGGVHWKVDISTLDLLNSENIHQAADQSLLPDTAVDESATEGKK